MMKDKRSFKLIEEVKTKSKELLFWRLEYRRRKAKIENSDRFFEVKQKAQYVQEQLVKKFENNRKLPHLTKEEILDYAQRSVFMEIFGFDTATELWKDEVNVRPFFLRKELSSDVFQYILTLNSFSMDYGYSISDLLQGVNIEDLLEDLNSEIYSLPEPPRFFANRETKAPLPEEVLTLIRCNPSKKKEYSIPGIPWEKLSTEDAMQFSNMFDPHPYGSLVEMAGLKRFPDFIVMAQVLSDKFDFEKAIKDIKHHMAWIIYDHKNKHDKPFSMFEAQCLLDFYNEQAEGQYGPSYAYARAVGLWIWDDYINRLKQSKKNFSFNTKQKEITKTSSFQAFQKTGLNKYYGVSDPNTFNRLINRTNDCIEAGEVQSIRKCSKYPERKTN